MIQFGEREVKSLIIRRVVANHVGELVVKEIAAKHPDPAYKPKSREINGALRRVTRSLRPLRTDNEDQRRYKQIVARGLAGFGGNIERSVFTTNNGDERLSRLQTLIQEALPPSFRK